MEIIASALLLASVVLPVIAVIALIGYLGVLAYSWATDLRTVEVEEVETATGTVTRRSAVTSTS